VSTSTTDSRSAAVALWTGRLVASFILILGVLVFVTFVETGLLRDLTYAVMGVAGALLFIVGIERSSRPSFRWVQLVCWLMMAGFSLIPTSLLLLPLVVVLAALPALFLRFQRSGYAGGRPPGDGQRRETA
jgi:small-conductance mechanosensitive channel